MVRGAEKPLQDVSALVRGAEKPLQDVSAAVRGAEKPLQDVSAAVRGAEKPLRDVSAVVSVLSLKTRIMGFKFIRHSLMMHKTILTLHFGNIK